MESLFVFANTYVQYLLILDPICMRVHGDASVMYCRGWPGTVGRLNLE